MITLHKIVIYGLWKDSLLAGFEEASSHAGEEHVARNWEWPQAVSQKEIEALSSTPNKELNATNNHINLDMAPSPVEPLDEDPTLADNLIEALQRTQQSHAVTTNLQKLWDNNMYIVLICLVRVNIFAQQWKANVCS